jgi:hypothetical protein
MTGDPIFWCLVLGMGTLGGIVGYFKIDRENFQRSGAWWLLLPLYFLMGLIGAVAGAVFVGPLLQISWQLLAGSPTNITWPQPISLHGLFHLAGTVIGTTTGVMTVVVVRRLNVGR